MYNNIYPLAAIVSQETLKKSLMIGVVNPAVGGLLIRGEKGTAKSTAVRALADILPEISIVESCTFSCNPDKQNELCPECRQKYPHLPVTRRKVRMVNLPLNATEDRVAGGIDFSLAVKHGRRELSPGLLADAHRGILYVDEVNLLDDHIVDIILDSAASGENRLEREGISFRHLSHFMLVGTMNPEEGELRPQLLDRFGLCVEVIGAQAPDERVRLMECRDAFDLDQATFIKSYQSQSEVLARQIEGARRLLPQVHTSRHLRGFITQLCSENHVAGHRADLVLEQAARALAALEMKTDVTVDHIRMAAPMVLIHRRRDVQQPPPPPPPKDPESGQDEESQQETSPDEKQPDDNRQNETPANSNGTQPEQQAGDTQSAPSSKKPESLNKEDQIFEIGSTFKVKNFSAPKDRIFRRGSGRRSRTRISQKQGRYVKSCMNDKNADIALDATLRAAAPYQKQRKNGNGLCIILTANDIRNKIREKRIGNFLLFAVDASGSMGARGRMAASKGAIMSLLLDAYQKRDRVAMISFRRDEAVVNLPPTTSVEMAGKMLAEMPVGGRTPLSAGLAKTYEQVRNILIKDPTTRPIVILITDGKGNVAIGDQKPVDEALRLAEAMSRDERTQFIIVDTEEAGLVSFGLANHLAAAMHAKYFKIDDLKAQSLVDIVKGQQS
ncbi:MAG: putative cobaltochelatase [Proteobacteria bacterium]|nr:putative cobaltochelatase [Pseudomonadota bacterium]